MEKRFTMIDENFTCEYCGNEVKKAGYTARDHCPYCLSSKHVDINPGDRKQTCHGQLKPIGYEKHKNTFKIIYKCEKCGEIRKNIMAKDDNLDKLLEICQKITSCFLSITFILTLAGFSLSIKSNTIEIPKYNMEQYLDNNDPESLFYYNTLETAKTQSLKRKLY